MTSRENIFAALYNLLTPVTWTFNGVPQKFNYTSRRLISWDNVNTGQQPALFLRESRETIHQNPLGLPIKNLRGQIWVYLQAVPNADQSGVWPSQLINPLLDAIETAILGAVPGQKQTLGGLVENCWIDGDLIMDDPVAPDQQIVIVIPISISVGF